ncbi:MAG TPA: FecR family protein, partial [Desertimonas sp.]|nr:FecR family protein [Desertimonas sp.]
MTQRRILASPRRRARQTTAHVAIAAICSVALWSGAGSALASTERDPVVVGDASAIEAGVEVRGGADAPFVLLEAVEPVAVGDGVRTDVTGFAEIAYLDGSRTRLDIDTEFEVVELTDDAGVSTTRTSMGVGRTWHRVESLGEGEFTVETSQATATVRGTAFVLDCVSAGNCSYVVFEGVIEVALGNGSVIEVIGPAKVEVVGGVAGPVIPVTLAELLADPWLVANVKRDIGAGFDDLVTTLGTDEAEPTTTELATTSTTTADTSTTTEDPFTTTTDLSTTTTDPSTTTTDSSTTTTESPNETTSTMEPSTSTTEEPKETTS